jgi:hypothetical protein
MAVASLAFMMPLKLTQMVLFRGEAEQASKQNDEDEDEDGKENTELMSLSDFGTFASSILFYLLPLSRPTTLPTWKDWSVNILEYSFWIALKCVMASALQLVMIALLEKEESDAATNKSPAIYAKLLILFSQALLATSWQQDLQCLFVHLLTSGNYEVLPFTQYVWFSSSLKDFWGKRYNRLINHLLLHTVYLPAQNHFNYSKRAARYLSFLVSGVMHVYIAHFAFDGRGRHWRSLLFFLAQPLWIELEAHFVLPVGRTYLFFFMSSILYVGLFVEAMPDWLERNETPPTHPFIDDYLGPQLVGMVLKALT